VKQLIAAALFVLLLGADAFAQRTIVLVRHAEKLDHTDDPPLAAAGLQRATALANLLRGAGVSAIIATEFRRTQSTAEPLAKRLRLTPEIIKALQVDALVARLRRSPADAVVLVVGHSNTLPIILTKLGWTGTLDLQDRDYDDVFVVTPRGEGEPAVLRLMYGKQTS
jgi:broad specificity phosphatase PhoE